MLPAAIRAKFGNHYAADALTFKMGIDYRLTTRLAERFRNRVVLETCTGGGFTTLSLAREALHVITVEIDPRHQAQARHNLALAGLLGKVTVIEADILNPDLWPDIPPFDTAFLDPAWAGPEPAPIPRFRRSNTRPPADTLLQQVFAFTPNAALILPPTIPPAEFDDLPPHELQRLYLDNSFENFCLWFGDLIHQPGETELRA